MAENKCDELFSKNGELVEFRKKQVLEGALEIVQQHYKEMNDWWKWFKEIPSSVKIKYFIALPIGILLFVISWIGELAETLSDIVDDWVRGYKR